MDYPKYKYHATGEPVVVHSKEDEDSLGAGYEDSPAAHGKPSTAPSTEEMSAADVAAIDKRQQAKQDLINELASAPPLPTDELLRRVDLATAQRTVKKAPKRVAPLEKTSGDDKFGGDWTLAGEGTDYPREVVA